MDVLRHCPYCGAPAADVWAEVAHMNAAHPDVIARRLEAAGIREEPPSLAQQLAGAVSALEQIEQTLMGASGSSAGSERAIVLAKWIAHQALHPGGQ